MTLVSIAYIPMARSWEQQTHIYQTVHCLPCYHHFLMLLKLLCKHDQPPKSQRAGISIWLKGQLSHYFNCL